MATASGLRLRKSGGLARCSRTCLCESSKIMPVILPAHCGSMASTSGWSCQPSICLRTDGAKCCRMER
eukprot:4604440-Alexandrium_andersonii.AAC.1